MYSEKRQKGNIGQLVHLAVGYDIHLSFLLPRFFFSGNYTLFLHGGVGLH